MHISSKRREVKARIAEPVCSFEFFWNSRGFIIALKRR
jgi:hypothetical protein